MPTLDWIGKKAVINHIKDVPFHLLKSDEKLAIGDTNSGNLLIQGDNLIALKALLPYYAGQVKCIYIDPPYNTGEQTWVYNDSVNSVEIRNWLGKVVGRETEDLSRHDKWLCMMYPRMRLLVQFLSEDGFLLVSLDDAELYRFKLMMEEILTPKAFVATCIWKSRRNLDNRSLHNVSIDHEYVIAFRKGAASFRGAEKDKEKYSNPDNDLRGPWMSDNLVGLATKDRRPNLHYDLINPKTVDSQLKPLISLL
jgi:adenine specific DNA methylase Mod